MDADNNALMGLFFYNMWSAIDDVIAELHDAAEFEQQCFEQDAGIAPVDRGFDSNWKIDSAGVAHHSAETPAKLAPMVRDGTINLDDPETRAKLNARMAGDRHPPPEHLPPDIADCFDDAAATERPPYLERESPEVKKWEHSPTLADAAEKFGEKHNFDEGEMEKELFNYATPDAPKEGKEAIDIRMWKDRRPRNGGDAPIRASLRTYIDGIRGAVRRVKWPKFAGRPAEEIEDAEPEFLWERRILRGKLNQVFGEMDVGKGYFLVQLTVHITRGIDFPDGAPCKLGKVYWFTGEDDPEDVKLRLVKNGADMSRIAISGRRDKDGNSIVIKDYVKKIKSDVQRFKPDLIVIEPFEAFVGDVNTNANSAIRNSALNQLTDIAKDSGAAVVILNHANKDEGMSAGFRSSGSVAISAACRAVMLVGFDRSDPTLKTRVLAWQRCSYAPPNNKSRAFTLTELPGTYAAKFD